MRLEVIQFPREQHVDALQDGVVDLVISHTAAARRGILETMLFSDHYCAVSANGLGIGPDDYLSASHVRIVSGGAEAEIDRRLAEQGKAREVTISVLQYSIALELVRSTSLVATVPERVASTAHGIATFVLPVSLSTPSASLFWHSRTDKDPANTWLRELIADCATALVPPGWRR